MRLRLPPLRERKEDIPVLVAYFLERYGNGHQVPADLMNAFWDFDWPGNIRQLEHAIQQMVAMNSGPSLTLGDLNTIMSARTLENHIEANAAGVVGLLAADAPVLPLAEVERRAIMNALEYTKGDRTAAAELLDIGRTTLYRKLKEYGL
jgi:DNA-binding NtrC family response regulator